MHSRPTSSRLCFFLPAKPQSSVALMMPGPPLHRGQPVPLRFGFRPPRALRAARRHKGARACPPLASLASNTTRPQVDTPSPFHPVLASCRAAPLMRSPAQTRPWRESRAAVRTPCADSPHTHPKPPAHSGLRTAPRDAARARGAATSARRTVCYCRTLKVAGPGGVLQRKGGHLSPGCPHHSVMRARGLSSQGRWGRYRRAGPAAIHTGLHARAGEYSAVLEGVCRGSGMQGSAGSTRVRDSAGAMQYPRRGPRSIPAAAPHAAGCEARCPERSGADRTTFWILLDPNKAVYAA
jgi:hypothetical protein